MPLLHKVFRVISGGSELFEYLYLFDIMVINVNKGPAAQDFKIEIIVISASMHKVFKELFWGVLNCQNIVFESLYQNVCKPEYEPRCSRFQGSYD